MRSDYTQARQTARISTAVAATGCGDSQGNPDGFVQASLTNNKDNLTPSRRSAAHCSAPGSRAPRSANPHAHARIEIRAAHKVRRRDGGFRLPD